jgi:hypothetical protein
MSPEQKLFLERLSLRNLAPRTVENYRHALIKLSQFHNNSPLIMTSQEIEEFLLHEVARGEACARNREPACRRIQDILQPGGARLHSDDVTTGDLRTNPSPDIGPT